jgi:hypothetical protein
LLLSQYEGLGVLAAAIAGMPAIINAPHVQTSKKALTKVCMISSVELLASSKYEGRKATNINSHQITDCSDPAKRKTHLIGWVSGISEFAATVCIPSPRANVT